MCTHLTQGACYRAAAQPHCDAQVALVPQPCSQFKADAGRFRSQVGCYTQRHRRLRLGNVGAAACGSAHTMLRAKLVPQTTALALPTGVLYLHTVCYRTSC